MIKKKKGAAPESDAAADAAEIKSTLEANQIGKGEQPTPPPAAAPPAPKKDEKPKVKPQRVENILIRHDFSILDLANLGGVLADRSRILSDLEGEAKACARQYKDRLTTIQTEVDSTVNNIKEGFEMVPIAAIVMVQIDRKHKTATKAYYRKDTGVFIKSEDIISNTELELFNILPENRAMEKPLDEKLLKSQV
jgi:hypothetical protein